MPSASPPAESVSSTNWDIQRRTCAHLMRHTFPVTRSCSTGRTGYVADLPCPSSLASKSSFRELPRHHTRPEGSGLPSITFDAAIVAAARTAVGSAFECSLRHVNATGRIELIVTEECLKVEMRTVAALSGPISGRIDDIILAEPLRESRSRPD